MKTLLQLLAAASITLTANAQILFDGFSLGQFSDPLGPPGMVASFSNANQTFSWGTPTPAGASQSSLTFTPTSFQGVSVGQFFSVGSLLFNNGQAVSGTQAGSVDLITDLTFTNQTGINQHYDLTLGIISTPNTANPVTSADTVSLASGFPPAHFTIDDIEYTLEVGFGTPAGGFTNVTSFSAFEDASTQAPLVGQLSAVPEPSVITLAVAGLALVGISQLVRKKFRALIAP